jgi:type IV pilus assembly protein PilE
MRKSKSGFTIVELLVVIAVIGILTTIGIMSFTRYQASSRDTQRSSRTTLIAEALEKYYDKNGEYPSCSTLTQSATIVDTTARY